MLTRDQAEAASEALLRDARAKQVAAVRQASDKSKNHLFAGLCLLVVGAIFSYLAATSPGPHKGGWLLAIAFLFNAAIQLVMCGKKRNA